MEPSDGGPKSSSWLVQQLKSVGQPMAHDTGELLVFLYQPLCYRGGYRWIQVDTGARGDLNQSRFWHETHMAECTSISDFFASLVVFIDSTQVDMY